jgi:hypothetical protein
VRPARWGSGFLRCGIDPGAASPVCFAAPPLAVFGCAKRSLRSHARINPSTQPSDVARGSRSRAGELTLGLLSGEEHGTLGFGYCGVLAPHRNAARPALSRGRGSRFVGLSKSEFNAVLHVGVSLPVHAVSSLSLRERARVRVGFWLFKFVSNNQNLPTRFSGCPSDVRSLVFGCRRKLGDRV